MCKFHQQQLGCGGGGNRKQKSLNGFSLLQSATSVSHFIITLFWYFNLIIRRAQHQQQWKKNNRYTQSHSYSRRSAMKMSCVYVRMHVLFDGEYQEWVEQSKRSIIKTPTRINTLWLTFFRLVIGVDDALTLRAHSLRYCFAHSSRRSHR